MKAAIVVMSAAMAWCSAVLRAAEPPAVRIAALIKDLDADDFRTRDRATEALLGLGKPVLDPLKAAAAASASVEVRMRAERIIDELDWPDAGPTANGLQLTAKPAKSFSAGGAWMDFDVRVSGRPTEAGTGFPLSAITVRAVRRENANGEVHRFRVPPASIQQRRTRIRWPDGGTVQFPFSAVYSGNAAAAVNGNLGIGLGALEPGLYTVYLVLTLKGIELESNRIDVTVTRPPQVPATPDP